MGGAKSKLLEDCGVTWHVCWYCGDRMSARECSDRDDIMHTICRKKYEAECADARQQKENT